MINLTLGFPNGYTPNDSQKKILRKLDKALNNNTKFIVINAPTGAGKSFIPKTLSNVLDGPSDTYINSVKNYSIFSESGDDIVNNEPKFGIYALTITKALQDQYTSTFKDTGILKGQSNYQCTVEPTLSVDVAPCLYVSNLKQKCWSTNSCPYYTERNNMLISKFSTLNYSMFFSLPNHLKKRKIILCDEGSELEDQLVNQFTCEIDISFLVKTKTELISFPIENTKSKIYDWLKKVIINVSKNVEYYKNKISNKTKTSEVLKLKNEYNGLVNLHQKISTLIETFYDSDYIIEQEDRIIKFVPTKVDNLSKQIFDHADHVVIMSATIIDHKNFTKNLGIHDYEYITVDSAFDPIKSPIYIMVKQKINFKNLPSMLPTLVKQIKDLLKEHPNEKGVIHTHTQYITNYIRDNLKSDRLLCREYDIKNEDLLELHEKSDKPTVLVSPSMTYGVDLKGDLAKFQIILKAPWLPTKDKRIEKLMKMDKHWYVNRMLCTLIQACGRGTRSENDECVTYILDGSIYDAIVSNKSKIPDFFLNRIQ